MLVAAGRRLWRPAGSPTTSKHCHTSSYGLTRLTIPTHRSNGAGSTTTRRWSNNCRGAVLGSSQIFIPTASRRRVHQSSSSSSHALSLAHLTAGNTVTTTTTTTRRNYHATPQREILPLIAVGLALGVGRYSYRAVQRMKSDEEDYQWELQQYEASALRRRQQQGGDGETEHANVATSTVAIDLGTVFTKIATTNSNTTVGTTGSGASAGSSGGVQVMVRSNGARAVFNGLVYDNDVDDVEKVVTARGDAALERYYFTHEDEDDDGDSTTNEDSSAQDDVTLPFTTLATQAADLPLDVLPQTIVSDVLEPARVELDELRASNETSDLPQRQVVCLPCPFLHQSEVYQKAFATTDSTTSENADHTDTQCVPDPVAAVWGAHLTDVVSVPHTRDQSQYLVIDVGGWTTQVAVVERDVVRHGTTLGWGGEHMVQACVRLLMEQEKEANSSAEAMRDARSQSLLQVHARHAVQELSTQTRVAVHVPYLFANPSRHHLEGSVARAVLDQEVQEYLRRHVVPHLSDELSPHLPAPTDFVSLWVSVMTQVLERAERMPSQLDAILLVGGGAKAVLPQTTVRQALDVLLGSSDLLKVPDASVQSELTVMGAAALLPSFEYSVTDGLVRLP